jgi:hypothetical protein
MKVFPGKLPSNFVEAVRMLTRPYEPISKKRYDDLYEQLGKSDCDFFLHKGKIVTIGNADDGFAIMPLSNKWQAKLLGKFNGSS